MKAENKLKPEDLLGGILVLFSPERTNSEYPLEEFPIVVYEYEVNGIKYISNRVRVQDANPLLKRYPKESALER